MGSIFCSSFSPFSGTFRVRRWTFKKPGIGREEIYRKFGRKKSSSATLCMITSISRYTRTESATDAGRASIFLGIVPGFSPEFFPVCIFLIGWRKIFKSHARFESLQNKSGLFAGKILPENWKRAAILFLLSGSQPREKAKQIQPLFRLNR